MSRAEELLMPLAEEALVIESSQLPVGSVAELRARCARRRGGEDLRFACLPENLRLGGALAAFREPDRIVAGVSSDRDRDELIELLAPIGAEMEWMRVESAEMTKHALNGFLATSVAFINEVAEICERVGADAAEVSRGLKSERRIGPRAYLAPGDAFAGGTLARDIGFLRALGGELELPTDVFAGVAAGTPRTNSGHSASCWSSSVISRPRAGARGRDRRRLGPDLQARHRHAETLERGRALPMAGRCRSAGSRTRPKREQPAGEPPEGHRAVRLSPASRRWRRGARGMHGLAEYREVPAAAIFAALDEPVVIDAAGLLSATLAGLPGLRYSRVGSPEPVRLSSTGQAVR